MERNVNEPNRRNAKKDMLVSALLAGVAVIVYGMTMSKGVFPGESAALLATVAGFNPLDVPSHPFFCGITGWFSSAPVFSLPARMALFSLVCSVLAVMLVYRVVSFFIRDVITEEAASDLAPRVSAMAGVIAAVTFMLSVPVWSAATRFQYQNFDVLLPLLAAQMLVWFAERRWRVFLVLFVLICSVGVVETPFFIPALPLLMMFALYVLWRCQGLSFLRVSWMFCLMFVTLIALFFMVARQFSGPDGSVSDMLLQMLNGHRQELRGALPPRGQGWIWILLPGVAPLLVSLLAVFRGLNNERSISQYVLHLVLSLLVFITLANVVNISPWYFLKPLGRLPTGVFAMTAMAAGYLFAYWYLLLKVRSDNRSYDVSRGVRKTGEWFGVICTYPFAALILVASAMNVLECGGKRGMFADRCAKAILDRMGSRTWLVTDGTLGLDPHLQIMAKERGIKLNLISPQRENNKAYLDSFWELIEEHQIFAEEDRQRMKTTLELGIVPFIQDWFAMDKDIGSKVAILGIPDLWYSAGLTPVPDFFMFSGSADIKAEFKDRPLLDEYMAFWKSMDADLFVSNKKGDESDPLNRRRQNLRRHMGFVANNLGFLLEDLDNEKDALTAYAYVTRNIDSDNISALFNRFEMTRRNSEATEVMKDLIEKEIREFLGRLKHRYSLWSLSRYYGYVRSPELFAKMGYNWARSGEVAAARAAADRVVTFLPEEQRAEALRRWETILNISDKSESEKLFQDILEKEPENRPAMLGLIRFAIQDGAMDKAQSWLERIAKLEENASATLGVEWATIHLMNQDIEKARRILQETTDLQPKNLQAWAMLALLQIQSGELDEVEKVILTRMEKAAGVDNYFFQITRAQLLLSKDPPLRHQAREALIRAATLRPEITGVKDMVLQLDMDMDDRPMAQLHARQILRSNRDHALANYVMGSLRLQEGEYGAAEDFLRRSAKVQETPATLNDLAEVLRRIKRWEDAEQFARRAVEVAPNLYIAWETLGAILLEANKDVDEAEQMVEKALNVLASYEPPAKDPRVNITLARIQLKKGNIEGARATIQQIETQKEMLQKFDLDVLAKLKEDARTFQR